MLRNDKGFTFAELMISMIILSVVLTMVTGTMVYISKRNSATDGKNHGYQIAKEKLIELQRGNAIVEETGSDLPSRNGIDYDRQWEIITDELPYPVTVTVYWTLNNRKDSVVVVGYVSSDVCAPPDNNTAPSDIFVTDIDDETITTDPIVIGKNGDIFVCNVSPYDEDVDYGDIVVLDWNESEADNNQFSLRDGSQIYSKTTTPGDYTVKVFATDCGGETFSKTINITVDDGIALELTPDPKTITEFEANGNYAGQMLANKAGGTFRFTSTQSTFAIDEYSGNVTVKDNSGLDHETAPTVTLPIKYILGDSDSVTGNLVVTVSNVNENPETISLSNQTITADAKNNSTVGTITGSGPDDNDHSDSLTYVITNSAGGAFDVSFNSLIVDDESKLAMGTKYISIRAFDPQGLYVDKGFNITIKAGASECDKYTPWNSGKSYNSGTIITSEGFVWKCTEWSATGSKPTPSSRWQAQSICGGIDHSSFGYYSSSQRYNATSDKHRIVKHSGNLYVCLKNEWGNLGNISNTYYWKNIGKF